MTVKGYSKIGVKFVASCLECTAALANETFLSGLPCRKAKSRDIHGGLAAWAFENGPGSVICRTKLYVQDQLDQKQQLSPPGRYSAIASSLQVTSPLGDTIATRSNTTCQQFCVLAHIASFFMQVIVMNLFISMSSETKKWQKYWLDPARLQNSGGFNRLELKQILLIIKENQASFMEAWNEYFGI